MSHFGKIKALRFHIAVLPIAICLLPTCIFSQDTIENYSEQKLENLAESSQIEEDDYSNLLEALRYYKKHPINLNKATLATLSDLGLLTELQISSLFGHIQKNGRLLSVYELQCIESFDPATIYKILPYVVVADVASQPPVPIMEMLRKGDHEIVLRGQQVLEDQTGFSRSDSTGICTSPDSRYIGSPQKIYSRYRFTYENRLSAGITAEKDAGELFFKKNNPYEYAYYDSLLNGNQKNGFDFYSAHVFIKNIGKIRSLVVGDYQLGFGQGLTVWSGLAYGKSSEAVNIKKQAAGIRPYTSVDENRFMRGIAVTGGIKDLEATVFFSRKKIDGNISLTDSINPDDILAVSSLQESGLHTTAGEIGDKDAVTQTVLGGNVSYRKRKYGFGITGTTTSLSAELNRDPEPYNQFDFYGKQISNLGADYSFLIHNFNFFGEISSSSSYSPSYPGLHRGAGFLNGCIVSLDPRVSFSILHRSYQRGFQNLYANTFSESSRPANEQGIYCGITATPTSQITINAYYDHYKFPWLKYQTDAPSDGSEYLIQVNYTPSKKLDTYLRIKQKDKFVNTASQDDIDFIIPFNQTNYRWHIGYQISSSLRLRNRVEMIVIDKTVEEKESGYLVYQDLNWKRPLSKLSITFRYALFDTKSYESRIYAYENDIPGSWSIPSYYNKGSRAYLMINYDITRNIEFWVRWSQTYYSNQNVISEGALTEINGRTKSEVKVQVKLKF